MSAMGNATKWHPVGRAHIGQFGFTAPRQTWVQ